MVEATRLHEILVATTEQGETLRDMPTFTFNPALSDLVTYSRLRSATFLAKGTEVWTAWVDGKDSCAYSSKRGETDPTKILKKDGYTSCDSVDDARAEHEAKIAAKLAEGFKPLDVTTEGEPEAFLSRLAKAPTQGREIAIELSARYFESKKKFAVLWLEGREVHQVDGKLGAFDSTVFEPDDDVGFLAARDQQDRLGVVQRAVDELLADGFVEKPLPKVEWPVPAAPKYLADWEALVTAKDPSKAFATHFAFLTDTAECKKVLKAVAAAVTGISHVSGELVVKFKQHELRAEAPWLKRFERTVPPSYQRFASAHNGAKLMAGPRASLSFRGVSSGALPGPDIDPGWLEEADAKLFSRFEAKDLEPTDVLARHQDWLIYDPFKKTSGKEPSLLFLSHEGGKPERVFGGDLSVPAVFLRYLAEDVA